MRLVWRIGLVVLLFLAGVVWVSGSGGEDAAAVRHFLRNLLRQLF